MGAGRGLGVKQNRHFGVGNQAAGCPNKGQYHAADEDAGEAVNQASGSPNAKGEDAEEDELADGERNFAAYRAADAFGGQVATDEDVGVGEQV